MSFEKRAKPIEFGSFSDTAFLGNPGSEADRQFASAGVDRTKDGNIADAAETSAPELYEVPDFQGASGQGANRPYEARKEGN